MKRLIFSFVVMALAALIVFSCEDETTAPEPDQKECILGTRELSFGMLCVGDSTERSFNVIAPSSNDKPVSGEISATCEDFLIVAGEGPFSISPGKAWEVTLRYKPSSGESDSCVVHTGSACGDVLCTGSAVICARCLLEPDTLEFGTICIGLSVQDSFTITADPDNTQPVFGVISESCPDFTILSGGGPYVLEPGEAWTVVVEFEPSAPQPLNCSIDLGSVCGTMECVGVGVGETAFFSLKPTSATTFDWESNFLISPPAVVLQRVSYDSPPWNNCAGGWLLDGSQAAEAGFELQDFPVPERSTSISLALDLDCEDTCVRMVLRYNTGSHGFSNPDGACQHHSMFFPITPGMQDIFVGTVDGASACEYDAVVRGWFGQPILFRFSGPCSVSNRIYRGEGRIIEAEEIYRK
ncbi:MAG: hypothetical protein JXB45_07060 [Candidatus Krumholzibacteriota bacterium]|nr:hypothetical protein [Candidatus Krumholzibacteriota bacterium]